MSRVTATERATHKSVHNATQSSWTMILTSLTCSFSRETAVVSPQLYRDITVRYNKTIQKLLKIWRYKRQDRNSGDRMGRDGWSTGRLQFSRQTCGLSVPPCHRSSSTARSSITDRLLSAANCDSHHRSTDQPNLPARSLVIKSRRRINWTAFRLAALAREVQRENKQAH